MEDCTVFSSGDPQFFVVFFPISSDPAVILQSRELVYIALVYYEFSSVFLESLRRTVWCCRQFDK